MTNRALLTTATLPRPRRLVRVVRLVAGFLLLLLFQLVGAWLARLARLPVPGAVLGLVLLAAAIELRLVPVGLVRPAAELLVRHLTLLYVPAGAALMLHWELVRQNWLPIAAAGIASTLAVLLVAGLTLQRLERGA
jgi:holin-like protein